MCMSTVTKTYKNPSRRTGIGYKCFRRSRSKKGNLASACMSDNFYNIGKWYTDTSIGTIGYGTDQYRKGFHIFKNLESAKSYLSSGETIKKVKYTNIVAEGIDYGECVIARKMMILKDKV